MMAAGRETAVVKLASSSTVKDSDCCDSLLQIVVDEVHLINK